MTRVFVLRAGLTLAGTACAQAWEIQLLWSTTGITSTAFRYSTAETNFLPYFDDTPDVVTEVDASGGPTTVDLFLWGRVLDPDDFFLCYPDGVQIYGLDLKFEGDATHGANVAYRHKKTGAGPYDRWDGSLGISLDGVMAAVTSNGIELVPYDNNDLYNWQTYEFLIGAAQVTGTAGQTKIVALDTAEGLGIAVRTLYGPVPDPTVYPAIVSFTPEPAGLLLMLVGLALRRR